MIHDVIVVGAGIAGLSLAREMRSRGLAPVVLERARGVGGRCATRRIDGQPVDHGVAFLHGRTPRFLEALDGVPDVPTILDWPRVRQGTGVPCQPQAFDGSERRVALAGGVSGFAKYLAGGLDVRLETNVEAIVPVAEPGSPVGRCWEVRLASGGALRARALALTMPAPSASTLLRQAEPRLPAFDALLPVLGLVQTLPCLTVIARYPTGTPAPAWEISLPRHGAAIHTILHDSSKRAGDARLILVIQARPGFSRSHLDDPVESWARVLLEEAAPSHGGWIARPELVQPHIWRTARVAVGSELAGPVAVRLDGGAVLGIAGDGFHEAGGVEGACLSGIALAERFFEMVSAVP
jgi:renalase